MQNGVRSSKVSDASKEMQAPVINIQTGIKENNTSKAKLLEEKGEKKIPLFFYTEPIFKAKKYDFL